MENPTSIEQTPKTPCTIPEFFKHLINLPPDTNIWISMQNMKPVITKIDNLEGYMTEDNGAVEKIVLKGLDKRPDTNLNHVVKRPGKPDVEYIFCGLERRDNTTFIETIVHSGEKVGLSGHKISYLYANIIDTWEEIKTTERKAREDQMINRVRQYTD